MDGINKYKQGNTRGGAYKANTSTQSDPSLTRIRNNLQKLIFNKCFEEIDVDYSKEFSMTEIEASFDKCLVNYADLIERNSYIYKNIKNI